MGIVNKVNQTNQMNLTQLSKEIHEAAKLKGWYDNDPSLKELRALVITELCEAIQADRKGHRANVTYFKKRFQEIEESINCEEGSEEFLERSYARLFKAHIKDSFEDELADSAIRILDYIGMFNGQIDLNLWDKLQIEVCSNCESIYDIIFDIQKLEIGRALFFVFSLAQHNNINLLWHIEAKMRYNKTRPYKHGKAY